jgi:glucose dehydrogenase
MSNRRDDTNIEQSPAVWTRREALIAGPAVVAALQAGIAGIASQPANAHQAQRGASTATEWLSYGGDKASSKYSPIDQIGGDNFSSLEIAWTWRSAEEEITKANPELKTWAWECTPLMVDGILYVSTSLSQVAAIDAATGKALWLYDPETWKNGTPSNNGFVHRGVAHWADGADRRILFGTGDGYLICLNAQTGKPIPTFGRDGRIDLTLGLGRAVDRRLYGVSSPPVICRDVVVTGSKVHDVPCAGDATRRRARLRCSHRQATVAVSLHPCRGRVRQRDVGGAILENDGCRKRLVYDERGRFARLRLFALQHPFQ